MAYPINVDTGSVATCRSGLVHLVQAQLQCNRYTVLSTPTRSVSIIWMDSNSDPFGPEYTVRTQKTLISKRLLATDEFSDAIKCAVDYLSAAGHA